MESQMFKQNRLGLKARANQSNLQMQYCSFPQNSHNGLLARAGFFTKRAMSSLLTLSSIIVLSICFTCAEAQINLGYFNSSTVTIPNMNWNILNIKQVTFRTCTDSGSLIYMRESQSSSSSLSSSSIRELKLSLHNTSIYFTWSTAAKSDSVHLRNTVSDNKWYTVRLKYLLGSLNLELQSDLTAPPTLVLVANSTYNPSVLDVRLSGTLVIGENFSGCIYQGPGVDLNAPGLLGQNIVWNTCPLSSRVGCGVIVDPVDSQAVVTNQTSDVSTSVQPEAGPLSPVNISGNSTPNTDGLPGTGNTTDSTNSTDVDDCWKNPCRNDATCVDLTNSFLCKCPPNFNGTLCEHDLARMYGCAIEPCLNDGDCIPLEELTVDSRKYRCQCRDGYTGVNCESRLDMCRARPCQTGVCISGENRYTCDCHGTGFKGVNCTEDINECENATVCGGYNCSNYPGGFSCNCPPGFDGIPCVEINECDSNPCKHDADCVDGSNSYSCDCKLGFRGQQCEENIDDCENNSCTDEHTRCVDGVNTYSCVCLDGFSGTPPSCTNINECNQNICQHNSTCTDSPGDYLCTCLPGYTGRNCETDINECLGVTCQNNASCVNEVNNFTCSCLRGFRGRLCEENINDCVGHQCLNDAECEDLIEDYKCNCVAGWEGRFCETDTNDCQPDPCKNGGKCTDRLNGFNCTCPQGYTDPTCNSNINECLPNPCLNNGECFDGIADYSCNCTSDWMGKNCSEVYDECSFKPCLNDGNCSSTPPQHNHTCDCPKGFRGQNCEENIDDCVGNACAPYQVCYDGIDSYSCGCRLGYSGSLCEDEIDECKNEPCRNGGKCNHFIGGYNCTCPQEYMDLTQYLGPNGLFLTGYNGTNCEIDIDECQYSDPPICQNEAKCENTPPGSFTCYCKASSTGKLNTGRLCETRRTYCDIATEPCANNGTCIELPLSSACLCAPGFTGRYCKTDINECLTEPCENNGTCTDKVNDYKCTCIEGTTGRNCEVNIDDCKPKPCLHGGQCHDLINGYSCNCSDTGYTGDSCEININDCVNHQCQHGSKCVDGVKSYTCDCLDAYEGEFCHLDVQECAAIPCKYNSTCLEYSNESLYEKGDPRFVSFSYETAAGYVCECVDGVRGVNCSEEINECIPDPCENSAECIDKFNAFYCSCPPGYEGVKCGVETNECVKFEPCKNGGTCEDQLADYNCTCPARTVAGPNYGGKNCTTYLSGCDRNDPCKHGDCLPMLVSERPEVHSYQCLCYPGYSGTNCEIPTVISFSNGTYITQDVEDLHFDLSLRFRTTLSNAFIVLCKFSHDRYVAVSLVDGRVQIKYQDFRPVEWSLVTKSKINDAVFHSLKVILTHNITVILPDEICTGQSNDRCEVMEEYSRFPSTSAHLYVGSIEEAGLSDVTDLTKNYVGCMDDVVFNKNYFIYGQSYGRIYGVKAPGCTKTEQCLEGSCNGNGLCEDLWDTFRCICHRPYYGEFCDNDYIPMTFGKNPETYATYALPPVFTRDSIVLSFFVTTRQEDGFILYAGNTLFTDSRQLAFISFKIVNGFLCGDFVKCEQSIQFDTKINIADGTKHMIEFSIQPTSLAVAVDSIKVYEANDVRASDTVCDFGFGFYVTQVYLGQIPETVSRQRRSTADYYRTKRDTAQDGQSIFNVNKNLDPFIGILQDIRVNSVKLGIGNGTTSDIVSPTQSNFTVGAESTQQICNEDLCLNGGNCSNVFYNDFKCDCKRGYRGKNCSEPDFCSYGSCPQGSNCVNLQDGYECVSPAQFSGSSSLTYRLSGNRPASVVTIEFRTRILFGAIFYIGQDDYFFKLRVAEGQLELSHKLNSEFSQTIRTRNGKLVNDGKWYQAHFEVINGTSVKLELHEGNNLVDESDLVTLDTTNTNFESMLDAGQYLILGRTSRINGEANFIGCLNQIRIGGVLLPFFKDELFENNTAAVKFVVQEEAAVSIGCQGPDVCATAICLHGGTCEDLWYAYQCKCLPDFDGNMCENKNINHCVGSPCDNQGNCIDGIGGYTCDCPTGFTGDRCETDINYCNANNTALCQKNNASCVEEDPNGFRCNCSEEFTGLFCNVRTQQSCPSSQDNSLCQNGGICSNISITFGDSNNVSSFNCACGELYEGPLCERRRMYCDMQPPPCQNGGICRDINTAPYYQCDCSGTSDFEGVNCTDTIDDCEGVDCDRGECMDLNRTHLCICNKGFCSKPADQCQDGQCQHGTCQSGSCVCTGTGYNGTYCEKEVNECTLPVCVNADDCQNLEGDFNCTCSIGYKNATCDQPYCSDDLCQNNAACDTNATHWICTCPRYYSGERCEVKGPCADAPCNATNSEDCTQYANMTYECQCKDGWEGQNCDENIDECAPDKNVCVNGTCKDLPGSFECQCTPGFTGPKCDTEINECQPDPCMNEGKCSDRINDYYCNCTGTGFEGKNCTDDINECKKPEKVCYQGNCTNTVGAFTCECGDDFVGSFCQYDNPCVNQTCSSNGDCNYTQSVSGDYFFYCVCNKDYEGSVCEKYNPFVQTTGSDDTAQPSTDDEDIDLAVVIGVIVGGLIFVILLILIIAFVMSARSKRATRGAYSPSQQETSGSRVELGNVLKKPPEERLI